MKLYKGSRKTGILLIVLLTLSIFSTEVLAGKIKRTCKAKYYGVPTGIDYSQNTSTGRMEKYLRIPSAEKVNIFVGERSSSFKAHGSCGKLVPNRCRKRSRNTLLKCARAQAQFPNAVPEECRLDNIENYPTQHLMSAIEKGACEQLRTRDGLLVTTFPKPYLVHLMLYVLIIGDEGCGKEGLGKTTVVDGRNYIISGLLNRYLEMPLRKVTISCD